MSDALVHSGRFTALVARHERSAQIQRRLMAQDRGFEIAQHGGGIDAQVVAQRGTQPSEHPERVGLPAGPIQREHQLSVKPCP